MSGDAYHISAPSEDGDGPFRVMRNTLRDAGADPAEVDYINAHGTSTPHGDKIETIAIKRAFGDHAYRLAVSSTKSMTGHLLGAAGGLETAILALAIRHGVIPPTINYVTPDPECDLDYTPNTAREMTIGLGAVELVRLRRNERVPPPEEGLKEAGEPPRAAARLRAFLLVALLVQVGILAFQEVVFFGQMFGRASLAGVSGASPAGSSAVLALSVVAVSTLWALRGGVGLDLGACRPGRARPARGARPRALRRRSRLRPVPPASRGAGRPRLRPHRRRAPGSRGPRGRRPIVASAPRPLGRG